MLACWAGLVFLRYSWNSLQLALRSDADLVFATTTPLTAGIPGIVARWLKGTPFVFEVRDLWPELPRAMGVVRNPLVLAALSALEWLSYHSADACIGLAPGICEGIAERGVADSRIFSIPNACDLELFQPLHQGETKQPSWSHVLLRPCHRALLWRPLPVLTVLLMDWMRCWMLSSCSD